MSAPLPGNSGRGELRLLPTRQEAAVCECMRSILERESPQLYERLQAVFQNNLEKIYDWIFSTSRSLEGFPATYIVMSNFERVLQALNSDYPPDAV